jgi:hypothetical protein
MPPATHIAIEEPSTFVLSGVSVSCVLRPTADDVLRPTADEWMQRWTSLLSVFRLDCDVVAILSTPGI